MMRHRVLLIALALAGLAGCVTTPALTRALPDLPRQAAESEMPVSAENITHDNAHKQAEALMQEISREMARSNSNE